MAHVVLILGKPGSGKTSSIYGLNKEEVNVISATGKAMPFRSDIPVYRPEGTNELTGGLSVLTTVLEGTKAPIVVIDDANLFLTFHKAKNLMSSNPFLPAKQVAVWFTQMMEHLLEKKTDQIFYIMAHTELEEDGSRVFKATGKFIRDDLVPESLTNIVIEAYRDEGEYRFAVKPIDNQSPVKVPRGMFEEASIPNDLRLLDKTIREYYKPVTKKEKK